MFWNNDGTFCNLLSEALGSAFSLFEEQEQALLAYCHFHSFLIFPKTLHCRWKQCTRRFGITGYSVHHKIRSQVQTNHALYSCLISHWVYQIYKEGGVLNRFSTPRQHFQTPWSEQTHCMENGQSIFLLSPRLVRFAHVRLLRYSNATLNRFWEKTHCFAVFIGKHFKIFYSFKFYINLNYYYYYYYCYYYYYWYCPVCCQLWWY